MDEYLCINDVFTAEQKRGFENLPVKGETYTLKEEVKSAIDNKIGLVFYELPNPSHPNGQEYSFRPGRFVKVDKTKGHAELVEEKELVHVLEKSK
jgi:hypothetical protein